MSTLLQVVQALTSVKPTNPFKRVFLDSLAVAELSHLAMTPVG